ncbi:Resolvase [uncultured virus]|nr:Resolvase [uncultured virus]
MATLNKKFTKTTSVSAKGSRDVRFRKETKEDHRSARDSSPEISDEELDPSEASQSEEEEQPRQKQRSSSAKSSREHKERNKKSSGVKFRLKKASDTSKKTEKAEDGASAKGAKISGLEETKESISDVERKEEIGEFSHVMHYNERVEDEEVINVIGYARVSTEMQAKKGTSITTQIERIKNYCAKNENFNLLCIAVDEGISGGKSWKKRPGLRYALKTTIVGDNLVVTDATRLSRDVTDAGMMERFLEKGGITLITMDRPIDKTPHGKLVRTIEKGMAQFQREWVGVTISSAMQDQSRRGVLKKRCSYGWRMDPESKARIRDEAEQVGIERLRELVRLYPDATITTIVATLNDPANGMPPHNRKKNAKCRGWYYNAVKNLFIREKIPHKSVLGKLAEEKKEYVPTKVIREEKHAKAKKLRSLKDRENEALVDLIEELRAKDPTIGYTAIAKEMTKEEIKLDSGRKISAGMVWNIMEKEGMRSQKDSEEEGQIIAFIKKLRTEEPTTRVAEIVRQLTAKFEPLKRGPWSHYNVGVLMKKHGLA